ncbi:MAG: hypothetical protein R2877_02290 [Bdellovibrionota bacterium]
MSVLPLALMVLFFFFLFRQIQVGGGKAMSFGKSQREDARRRQNENHLPRVFAGIEEAKRRIGEIIDFLKDQNSPKWVCAFPKACFWLVLQAQGKAPSCQSRSG